MFLQIITLQQNYNLVIQNIFSIVLDADIENKTLATNKTHDNA